MTTGHPQPLAQPKVSIPQAVWIACNIVAVLVFVAGAIAFQYRKRYGLHAIFPEEEDFAMAKFQYRKRYGLHAINSFKNRRELPL